MPPPDITAGVDRLSAERQRELNRSAEEAAMRSAQAQRNAEIEEIGRRATRSVYWLLFQFLLLGVGVYWLCKS